jgi:glucosamine--fructose-6-phosphate aminotransferase (isomerizing)
VCGIIGYIGSQNASEILVKGLKHLEYRGYDSVGVATATEEGIDLRKDKGMIEHVAIDLGFTSMNGHIGIGHTRWATHGAPCKENAHPHYDCHKKVVLVHNGVIENYLRLKEELASKGHRFVSDTDSEVIAHLMEEQLKTDKPFYAFIKSLKRLKGSYALAVMFADDREHIYIARKGSPLIVGVGKGEMFCASDIPAMLNYTKMFVPLEDGDVATLAKNGYKISDIEGRPVERKSITVDWDMEMAEKGGYPHFMLKEIKDQRHFINETLATDVNAARELVGKYNRIDIVACGTSYHAGLLLSYLLMRKGKNARAYIASDYQFVANPDENTLVVAITQSGETADVLQAVKFAKERKTRVTGITNVVGSSITRTADAVVYLNVGPEIGVAATKTFMAQLAVAYMLVYPREKLEIVRPIIANMLEKENEIKEIAAKLRDVHDVFFIGRGLSVPIAYEGSLKFKEISYIHSEAYPGGELKHGTLSLIENGIPLIAVAPDDETAPKLLGNLKETKSRGAMVISITDNPEIKKESDYIIELPKIDKDLYPFAEIVPLQLLAYHVSVLRGNNPDKPRNLAKSVTVE